MRISSLALLALTACGAAPDPAPSTEPTSLAAASSPAPEQPRIDCALGGARDVERVCTLEQASDGQSRLLTIRHPDGGFHRLRVAADGRVSAADGAERARTTPIDGGGVQVEIGDAIYLLPAGVR